MAGIETPEVHWAESAGAAGYLPVPVENILTGSVLPFSLYSCVEGHYILLRGSGKRFEEGDRDRLLENHIALVHIARADQPRYREYLDHSLRRVIAANLPPERKVKAFYSMAAGIGSEAILAPHHPRSIEGATEVVQGALALLEGGKDVLHRFMSLMSGQHSLVTHSIHVTNYGLALARAAGAGDAQFQLELGLGLLFHDVGLLQIPAKILQKRSPLTFEERCIVRRHPQLGAEIFLEGGLLPRRSRQIIHDHHERIDGTGYPRELKGADVTVEARIAEIVEAFDSLTTHRPFRRAVSSFEAIRTLRKEEPGGFDGDLLSLFIGLIGRQPV